MKKLKVQKGTIPLKNEDMRFLSITKINGKDSEECKRVGEAILNWLNECEEQTMSRMQALKRELDKEA